MSDIDKTKPNIMVFSEIPPNCCLVIDVKAFIEQLREVADLLEQRIDEAGTTTAVLSGEGLMLGKWVSETLADIDTLNTKGSIQ